ncbi:MAG: hypothetical protein F4Y82_03835 [Cenarchaeum sp. SB0665_bin_23]|nr:hypothetical protein [Cenarchaeum sp. SB0667_bin_13]MXY37688.1 hypothetical protein [Cenarchaeum sp. SB0664_bin_35]MXY61232.1 hypothetical protein [Cenarchaeum sp. SB0665_bin_23]MXZ93883.1 hypothetical protein [Cenarchaeum sp. SB0666_bin_15]MYB46139.1 hypothetical protein [Cenarchaeum sp. SB0662_bin_33]MYC79136.1 hypothetical protein [Cenarchaeum sp. SB0661_bin_35]MYD59146.1 hypothetical protein [Cenarchaeum sp. SB0678_bin_8]MYG33821.1 hypothetical protein [Cenarchaeum sp. SB0677_bin_16]
MWAGSIDQLLKEYDANGDVDGLLSEPRSIGLLIGAETDTGSTGSIDPSSLKLVGAVFIIGDGTGSGNIGLEKFSDDTE